MEQAAPPPPDDDETDTTRGTPAAGAPVTIFICTTCGAQPDAASPPGGERLHAAVAGAAADEPRLSVSPVKCLANCKRSLSAAIARADGWSYVFGDLSEDMAFDLITGARLLGTSEDGLMPWRGRPDPLKRGMVARLPPLPFSLKDHP